jgi:hypothetical protein
VRWGSCASALFPLTFIFRDSNQIQTSCVGNAATSPLQYLPTPQPRRYLGQFRVPPDHLHAFGVFMVVKPMMMKTQAKRVVTAGMVVLTTILTAVGANMPLYRVDPEIPGDHFSLEGALELFKKSRSPQEFEQILNSADSKVNNLDLNGDGDIDYIRVIDRNDRNVHAFILQAVISPNEFQDIAVIELEILANGKATLQIVGDADIYGIETIIEPTQEVRVNAGLTTTRTYVNVWTWPTVQYVYDPFYISWESPWGWYNRPYWWRPWRPVTYVVYRPYWDPYRPYYSVCHTRRIEYANVIYRPVRTTSVIVHERHHRAITYSRNTRGRDSQYYDQRDRQDRGRDNYSNNNNSRSSGTRYSGSGTRDTDNRSTGRTREQRADNVVAPSRYEETKPVRVATPKPRTSRESSAGYASGTPDESPQPRISFEQKERSNLSQQHQGGGTTERQSAVQSAPSRSAPRPAVSHSPSIEPRHSSQPRESNGGGGSHRVEVQRDHNSGGRSQRSEVQHSSPPQRSSSPEPRSHGSGSGSGSQKRGRD